MPKSTRKLSVPTGSKPVSTPATATKPVASKPAAVTAKPDQAAEMPRGLTRDAAGIVRAATNFAQYSDRDTAYLAFFGRVARANGGTATLRQIHDAGSQRDGNTRKRYNPNYAGSAKATDVGAVNRLIKAGYFTRSSDGHTIIATATAKSHAAYLGTLKAS